MFLLDTSVLIYRVTDSEYRRPCAEIVRAVVEKGAEGVVSAAVLEEVWQLELQGLIDGLDGVTADYYDLFSPLLPMTDEILARALTLDAPALGSSDRVHAATCLENGFGTIVSADPAFDGVSGLRRVDPLNTRAVAALLA